MSDVLDAPESSVFRDFPPPAVALCGVDHAMQQHGFVVLAADAVRALGDVDAAALATLAEDWNDLPLDEYLRDGGRYRRRRHASYVVEGGCLTKVTHRAHWQSLDYNALHGGMERWFQPVSARSEAAPAWTALITAVARLCDGWHHPQRWHVEAHQFRIDTADGIGRPTPEGAHRDGVDVVAVFLLGRHGIKGGETRVFAADGPRGQRFTLREPWSLLLLDDHRVIHESTPIQPRQAGEIGHRDTLVLTFRRGAFQGEE